MRDTTLLTPRFDEALTLAARVHAGDVRKGTQIPYVAHLLGVCALVLADGGDEDEGIAGLLHDTLEDHPDLVSRHQLEDRFGARVRRLVEGCTDTPADYRGGPKSPWRERKLHYLEHLRDAPPDELRVFSRGQGRQRPGHCRGLPSTGGSSMVPLQRWQPRSTVVLP